ncbi:MAG: rhamnulokinase family protein [Planctomycetota bacterium]
MTDLFLAAADLGASGGRVILGRFDGKTLSVTEIHRFPNDPVALHAALHWDILRLWHEVKEGLRRARGAARDAGGDLASIGIDTWGVDFGLIDRSGRLLENPVHYRDRRTEGMMEKVFARIPRDTLFRTTGIQFMPFNTLFQLAALRETAPETLDRAETLLFMPDLFHYFLTGIRRAEYTIASTSQLLDARRRDWAEDVINALGIPRNIFPAIVPPGAVLGKTLPGVAEELSGPPVPVVAVATHDTGSAVAAVPAKGDRFAYLSSGTWSLLGTEMPEPVLGDAAREFNFTNEGGVAGAIRLLKNITGLWALQETRRGWEREGKSRSWDEITAMTERAAPAAAFVDPDDPRFLPPGDMPARVRDFCRKTGQTVPATDEAVLRTLTESLALKTRGTFDRLESLAGASLPTLHMVGGGIRNRRLAQWTASACARPVLAGPTEASAIGNLAVQLMALGEMKSPAEIRALVRRSFPPERYEPEDTALWEEAYVKFSRILPPDAPPASHGNTRRTA